MPNYDFKKDLPIARKTEQEVAKLLEKVYDAEIMHFGNTNKYDIFTVIKGKPYKFEVKEDFTCKKTGNVGLEFECRGKPSGIQTSEADYYIYKIHTKDDGIHFYLFKTTTLKNMIMEKDYFRIVNGGDEGSNSMNYLFKYETFIRNGKFLL
jgi:hypothetical protein